MNKDNKKNNKNKNLRKELAITLYLDPRSSTFGNKTQSLIKAGYSEKYADRKGWEILGEFDLTDTNEAQIKSLLTEIPQIKRILTLKLNQLEVNEKISAKDYTAVLRHIEILGKIAGIFKQYIEKREMKVNISIPTGKCPQCGHIMDIIEEEYEHRKNVINMNGEK